VTALPNGSVGYVETVGRDSARACVTGAVRAGVKLEPWSGPAVEIVLPFSAEGEPVLVDAGG